MVLRLYSSYWAQGGHRFPWNLLLPSPRLARTGCETHPALACLPRSIIPSMLRWLSLYLKAPSKNESNENTQQYAPSGPLACSSHATFTMHGPLTVDLMPICTPRMNTLSSRKQGGDLEEIDHRGRHIVSRRKIGFYKNLVWGLYIRSRINFCFLGSWNVIQLFSIKSCPREPNRLPQAEFLKILTVLTHLTLKSTTLNLRCPRLSLWFSTTSSLCLPHLW